MKKFLLFASAFAILFTASCDEVIDDLTDDLEDSLGGGDDSSNSGSGNSNAVGLVKTITAGDDDESTVFEFTYDNEGRVIKSVMTAEYESDSEDVYADDSEVEVYEIGARSYSIFERATLLPASRAYQKKDVATRAATYTYTCEMNYTYSDSTITLDYAYTDEEDDDEEGTITIYINSDGSIASYVDSYEYEDQVASYNPDEGYTYYTETFRISYENSFTYDNGYLSGIGTTKYSSDEDGEDVLIYVRRGVVTWENGNLVNVKIYSDYNDYDSDGVDEEEYLLYENILSYNDDENTLNIDLVMCYINADDYITGLEPGFYGTSPANLVVEFVEIAYEENGEVWDYDICRYEYEYTDGYVTKITGGYGWGDNQEEAEENYSADSSLELTYYE